MILQPKIWIVVTAVTFVACIALILIYPPVLGIDFIGGSLLELRSTSLTAEATHQAAQALNLSPTVQTTETGSLLVRTTPLTPDQHTALLTNLRESDASLEELRFETVGPTIGAELRRKAWIAVSLSIIVTIAYLAYEFRHARGIVSPWKLGVSAAVALVHDLLVVTAGFAIMGQTHAAPLDALFVTAALALGGYSVNDTIVLFNRFKHEWLKNRGGSLLTTMDRAVKLTLTRSLNTSIPILLTLLTLLLFGGTTIQWFIVALTIGTITGAYSTIFVAPAVLYYLARK